LANSHSPSTDLFQNVLTSFLAHVTKKLPNKCEAFKGETNYDLGVVLLAPALSQ
jgi:hypothetical protein